MPNLSQIIRNKNNRPKPKYKSAILVNTADSFYFVYAYGISIKQVVDLSVDRLKEWKHRDPEVYRAYYCPNGEKKQDITAKIQDLTSKVLNGGDLQ